MSFSANVKKELMSVETESPCCIKSLAYGMLLFGRSFNHHSISMMTDNAEVAEAYRKAVKAATGVTVDLSETPSGKFVLSVTEKSDREKILDCYGMTGREYALRINRAILTNESDDENSCCFSAFVRGAFLSCGTVCDPNKMYALEFVVQYLKLSEDMKALLGEMGLPPKVTQRRGVRVVYYKDSTNIEDILTLMGAMTSSLELMSVKVYKDVRNRVNRRTNFETANITRTVAASLDQIEAIEYIEKNADMALLPADLRQTAYLRKENPDMSLRELGECFDPPVTRSVVNNKLMKLMKLAKNLKAQKTENNGGR
ncbi:MAG: DNA-binding protein WhiA [Oscillospiraceae bacterium]|nr:DNA-binding protein WhiA [Oscillospiraceae bacterium]